MNQRHSKDLQQKIIAAIQHLAQTDAEYYGDNRQLIKVWQEDEVHLAEVSAEGMDSLIYELIEVDEAGVIWQYTHSEEEATLAPIAKLLWKICD